MERMCASSPRATLSRLALMTLALDTCRIDTAGGGVSGAAISFECQDPLFRAHWHSLASEVDAGQLEAQPVEHKNLVRCKMWNYHSSCCGPSMESPQEQAFETRRANLERKVGLLKAYLASLESLHASQVYTRAAAKERALLDRALDSFRPALAAVQTCARALLEFVAGMVCFGCNPVWNAFVERDASGAVRAVNVASETCIYVDKSCGALGHGARAVEETVMASSLAKLPRTPLPDFSMFADRETLCAWLRSTLALQPMLGALPAAVPLGRRLPDMATNASGGRYVVDADAGHDRVGDRDVGGVGHDVGGVTIGTREDGLDAFDAVPPAPAHAPLVPPLMELAEAEGRRLPDFVLPGDSKPLPTAPPYATMPTAILDPAGDGRNSGFDLDVAAATVASAAALPAPTTFTPAAGRRLLNMKTPGGPRTSELVLL
mmetsp:Transcript_73447/g.204003  ORF Transcript_73447/g.204003 Transcript_73447/m.204003 type:complete len:434 (-) Transcript_73447:82-1383(-)